MQVRVQDLYFAVALDGICRYDAGAFSRNLHGFRAFAVQLGNETLDVQNDFGNIFLNTRNGGELVYDAVDLDRLRGYTRQAGKKHTAQAVAQRSAEAALQRLYHKPAVSVIVG